MFFYGEFTLMQYAITLLGNNLFEFVFWKILFTFYHHSFRYGCSRISSSFVYLFLHPRMETYSMAYARLSELTARAITQQREKWLTISYLALKIGHIKRNTYTKWSSKVFISICEFRIPWRPRTSACFCAKARLVRVTSHQEDKQT